MAAGLPDEINYPPFQSKYSSLYEIAAKATAKLNGARSDLRQNENMRDSLIQSIANRENEISSSHSEISSSRSSINGLENDIRGLEQDISRLESQASSTDSALNRAERNLSNAESDYRSYANQYRQYASDLSTAKNEYSRAATRFNNAENKVSNLRRSIQKMRSQRDAYKSEADRLRGKLSSLESNLSSARSDLSSAQSEVSSIQSDISRKKAQKDRVAAQASSVRSRISTLQAANPNDPQIATLKQKLRSIREEVRGIQASINHDQSVRLSKAKNRSQRAKQKIANLESARNTLPGKIQSAQNNARSLTSSIQSKKSELDQARSRVATASNRLSRAEASKDQAQRNYDDARYALSRREEVVQQYTNEVSSLSSELSRLNSAINQSNASINNANSSITSFENYIDAQRASISANERAISSETDSLASVRSEIPRVEARISTLEGKEAIALRNRNAMYAEFSSRKKLYDKYDNEAIELARVQAVQNATPLATDHAKAYVESKTSELADINGAAIAKAQGQLWGGVRAEIKGYADGYEIGLVSSEDINRGQQEGEALGIKQAHEFAQAEHKPTFFEDFYLKQIGQAKLQKQKSFMKVLNFSKSTLEVNDMNDFDIIAGVEPITQRELGKSKSLKTGADRKLSRFYKNLNSTLATYEGLKDPSSSYVQPDKLIYGKADCTSVYKNISNFIKSCKSSYAKIHTSTYARTHEGEFSGAYLNLYTDKTQVVLNSKLEAEFEKEYMAIYPVGETAGIIQGKSDIFDKTFAESRELAYDQELSAAIAKAKVDGEAEALVWIKDHATLKLNTKAAIVGRLRGGDSIKLKLDFKNISQTDLKQPVRISVRSINARTLKDVVYLKAAKGGVVTIFDSTNFSLKKDLASSSKVTISGLIEYPASKYKASRTEKFTVSGLAEVNPAVSLESKFDSSPRVVSAIRRRTLIHKLSVDITSLVDTVKEGQTVTISSKQAEEGLVLFKNTSVKTAKLVPGTANKVDFKYTFKRAAEGKEVSLKICSSYKGEVIKCKTEVVKPH